MMVMGKSPLMGSSSLRIIAFIMLVTVNSLAQELLERSQPVPFMAAPIAPASPEPGTASKSNFQFGLAHFWGDSGTGGDFSVPSTFTERVGVEHRRDFGPIAFISATGFGLNRGDGDLWRSAPVRGAVARDGASEESLFVQAGSI